METINSNRDIKVEKDPKISDLQKTKAPPKTIPWLTRIITGVIFFLIGFYVVRFLLSNSSPATNVNVNSIDYHYYDSQTGANWTYDVPLNYTMIVGSSFNGTFPFTSNINCSLTITKAYSLTPGFVYQIHNLPLTFLPYTPTDYIVTIVAPYHPYSGSLNVEIYVNYPC